MLLFVWVWVVLEEVKEGGREGVFGRGLRFRFFWLVFVFFGIVVFLFENERGV